MMKIRLRHDARINEQVTLYKGHLNIGTEAGLRFKAEGVAPTALNRGYWL